MVWFIGFIVLMIVACFVTYRTAEVHELHKMRAAFEHKRVDVESYVKQHKNDPEFNDEFYRGEIEELDEVNTEIDKEIDSLKNFDLDYTDNLPKIKGFVARDKDNSLWFHYSEPHKENDIEETWWGSDDRTFRLYDFDYPEFENITFESGPVEVEFCIKVL